MSISRIKITDSNREDIIAYLAINYPNHKLLTENDYKFSRQGRRYNNEIQFNTGGKTVRIELENEDGLELEIPIEFLRRPKTTVIPVFITEEDCIDLGAMFRMEKNEKISYAQPEKVVSFKNFEIRNGEVVKRNNGRIMNEENLIIIHA